MLERVRSYQPLRALPAGDVDIKIAHHPFTSVGRNRHPYWALSTAWSRTAGDSASYNCLPWPDAVVKRFKEWKNIKRSIGPSMQANSRQAYEGQLEVQAIARELAKSFAAVCR